MQIPETDPARASFLLDLGERCVRVSDRRSRRQTIAEIDADTFGTDPNVSSPLLRAGSSPQQLHAAFDGSRRAIYPWLHRHDLDTPRPPTRGPVAALGNADVDTIEQSN